MIDIRDVQLHEFEILVRIDEFCKTNDIEYSLYAGTLLGAVRHSGFIPWDDDVDICMKRNEFEKFDRLLANNIFDEGDFYYQSYKLQKFYPSEMTKVRTRTLPVIEEVSKTQESYFGPWVDIFPYDNLPDDKILREKQFKKVKFYNKVLYNFLLMKESEGNSSFKNRLKKLMRIMNEKFYRYYFFIPYLLKRRHIVMTEYNNTITKYAGCLSYLFYEDFDDFNKGTILNENFKNLTKIKFEDKNFSAFENFDSILKKQYGDYMRLPAESERVQHNLSTV